MFWLWLIPLILICAIALSFLVGGGINFAFLKIVIVFLVGFVCLIMLKKLWDMFKGNKK